MKSTNQPKQLSRGPMKSIETINLVSGYNENQWNRNEKDQPTQLSRIKTKSTKHTLRNYQRPVSMRLIQI